MPVYYLHGYINFLEVETGFVTPVFGDGEHFYSVIFQDMWDTFWTGFQLVIVPDTVLFFIHTTVLFEVVKWSIDAFLAYL